jgi:hypothetical protein
MAKELLIGSLSVGLIFLSVFVLFSLDSLQYNSVGLNYSKFFKSIENKTYNFGFHFIGIGHTFIPYQLNVQTIEFSNSYNSDLPPISCRTKDGLSLNLEVAF